MTKKQKIKKIIKFIVLSALAVGLFVYTLIRVLNPTVERPQSVVCAEAKTFYDYPSDVPLCAVQKYLADDRTPLSQTYGSLLTLSHAMAIFGDNNLNDDSYYAVDNVIIFKRAYAANADLREIAIYNSLYDLPLSINTTYRFSFIVFADQIFLSGASFGFNPYCMRVYTADNDYIVYPTMSERADGSFTVSFDLTFTEVPEVLEFNDNCNALGLAQTYQYRYIRFYQLWAGFPEGLSVFNNDNSNFEIWRSQLFENGVTIGFLEASNEYHSGYINGYNDGVPSGYAVGLPSGYAAGYDIGYGDGSAIGEQSSFSFSTMLFDIIDAPFYLLNNLFDFTIFGIDFSNLIMFAISVILVGFAIKKLI